MGIKGIAGSQYNYQKVNAEVSQIWINRTGRTQYRLFAGKIFGQVPYPLLELHKGNQGLIFNRYAFNMMNEFEIVSDEYAGLWVEHHLEGKFLNLIPLIKKLKWREVFTFKGLAGRLDPQNTQYLQLAEGMRGLNNGTDRYGYYAEAGVGIENIFALGRIDFLWRLTQRDDPTIDRWGIKLAIQPKF
jgi:hypothetical protein